MATFNLNRDIDVAAQDVRDRVAAVRNRLPNDAMPPVVSKFDNDESPILTIALSGDRSIRELTEIADKSRQGAARTFRVAWAKSRSSAAERAINVWVDADRLAAYQLPITAVRDAIVGRTPMYPAAMSLPHAARADPADHGTDHRIPRLSTTSSSAPVNGSPIRIRDIGRAEDGTKEQRSLAALERRADRDSSKCDANPVRTPSRSSRP